MVKRNTFVNKDAVRSLRVIKNIVTGENLIGTLRGRSFCICPFVPGYDNRETGGQTRKDRPFVLPGFDGSPPVE